MWIINLMYLIIINNNNFFLICNICITYILFFYYCIIPTYVICLLYSKYKDISLREIDFAVYTNF